MTSSEPPGNTRPPFASIDMIIATWLGCGLSPFAPGTVGSLGALPAAYAIVHFGGWPWLAAAVVLVTVIGTWVTASVIASSGIKDPGFVVVDEVAGQWIALIPAALDPVLYAVGFAAFRLFDIWKPWPVGWADRKVGGAWGVMLDDLIAGGFAAIVVYGVRFFMTGGA